MIDRVKTKQIKWEDLEVIDKSTQIHQDLCEEITEWEEGNEPVPTRCKCCVKSEMDSLTIDWIPELIEEVIVNWHRPRVERWYIMPGLGPLAERMHQEIQQEIERRSLRQSQDAVLHNLTARTYGLTPADLGAIAVEGYLSGFDPGTSDFTRMLEITRDAETANAALDSERLATECMEMYIAGLNQNTTLNDFRGLRAAIRDLVDSVMASFDTFFKACSSLFEVRVLCIWDEFIWNTKNKIKRQPGMEAWEIHLTDHFIRDEYQQYFQRYYSMTEVEFNDLRVRGQATVRDRQERLINSQLIQEWPPGGLNLGSITEEELNRFRAQMLAFCTPSRLGLTGRQ